MNKPGISLSEEFAVYAILFVMIPVWIWVANTDAIEQASYAIHDHAPMVSVIRTFIFHLFH